MKSIKKYILIIAVAARSQEDIGERPRLGGGRRDVSEVSHRVLLRGCPRSVTESSLGDGIFFFLPPRTAARTWW
jgi:hypothetical protein